MHFTTFKLAVINCRADNRPTKTKCRFWVSIYIMHANHMLFYHVCKKNVHNMLWKVSYWVLFCTILTHHEAFPSVSRNRPQHMLEQGISSKFWIFPVILIFWILNHHYYTISSFKNKNELFCLFALALSRVFVVGFCLGAVRRYPSLLQGTCPYTEAVERPNSKSIRVGTTLRSDGLSVGLRPGRMGGIFCL